jgi:N-acetylglucosaminyldiphosphoundecaprenol N-acetyl-beta-D-mannosaminyltransferase
LRDARHEVLGVPIDFIDTDTLVARIVAAAREQNFFQVATVNVDFMVHSCKDNEVRDILAESAINVPDGAPLAWAGRLLGVKGAARLAGADLVPPLMEAAARHGLQVFLLGGENDAAAVAAEQLVSWHPELNVSSFEPPRASLEDMDNCKIFDYLDDARPHILLVAFGHPKQEQWIHRNRASLPMVAIGVGCCLDLVAGRYHRAPQWMQKGGLEWVYRMVHEPRRLVRRYATDGLWVIRDLFPWLMSQRLSHAR